MTLLAFILVAYLIGSIPFALIASWIFRLPDPRTYGSKNPGATNVLRSGKKSAAVLTLIGDAGKGWLAIALAQSQAAVWHLGDEAVAVAALAVFIGHIFPVFLRFQGGKGVATAVGVLLGLKVLLGLLAIATWIAVAVISRYSSLSALIAALLSPVYAYLIFNASLHTLTVSLMALLLIWRHQSNIVNLLTGKESRIGQKKTLS
ncbi:MAG: glycerol-3-phosphate 1-O-acyltransferase PlsY [Nitrosomonas sp.]|nr:glycerol-3-phosphate 1-O-acyltransferase PlsY [Nitrosomonas sp.]MCP5251373.1 glycerol-3-phosphate 1-O-acyltransferase PlsY [Burkholderiales bacterium]MCP5291551.1 glycerol-3-phosphate 1-O-acyltransferase PlsY [Burkholderiales bacterium]HQU62730.1 glycerol-3-phosphate 1-O-acyltransferase PlsY [Nitrosomonas sp.]